MLFKLVSTTSIFLSVLACNAEMPSEIAGTFAHPYCSAMGGAGAEDTFSCGERACSYDSQGDEQSICVVDADAVAKNGLLYHIGDGYDLITDKTSPSCLIGADTDDIRPEVLNKAESTFDLVRDHEEFYEKDTTTKKFGIGGFFGWLFGGGFSRSKTTITENSRISDSLYLTASFSYTTKKMSMFGKEPKLTPMSKQLLLSNSLRFRSKCGDQYVKAIKEGGRIVLSFKADINSERNYSKETVETAFKIGLGGLFSVSTDTAKTQQVEQLLETMRVTSSCKSVGASPELCANHQLDQESYKLTDDVLKARIEQAKNDLIEEVKRGNVASIGEELDDYPLVISSNKSYFDYFYDYRPLREKFSKWADAYVQVEENCDYFDYPGSQCMSAEKNFKSLVDICMKQSSWNTAECQENEIIDPAITRITNLGELTFFTEADRSGNSFNLDFKNISIKDQIIPGKVYNLTDLPFSLNGAKSLDFKLKSDWQVVLYTKNNGLGEKLHISSNGSLQGKRFVSFEIQSK
jgi:hypothetical protein